MGERRKNRHSRRASRKLRYSGEIWQLHKNPFDRYHRPTDKYSQADLVGRFVIQATWPDGVPAPVDLLVKGIHW